MIYPVVYNQRHRTTLENFVVSFLDINLSGYTFDLKPALMRDRIGNPEERSETYDERYDFSTFFYDAYYDSEVQEICLIAPTLINFVMLLKKCRFFVDSKEIKLISVEKLSRGNLIRLSTPGPNPKTLAFKHPLFSGEVEINRYDATAFANKNAICAISKDNNLEWIRDWLTYYVNEHGLQAVVLFDNQSTTYSMEELGETLTSVSGIEAAALVRAWYPFGPGGGTNTNYNSKFLHMTMVEFGRRNLLSNARAVLNVDIDEIVYSNSGRSIFDATVDNPKGYQRFNGKWVYADPKSLKSMPRHRDHQYIRSDGKPKVNRKWCVAPQGRLKGKIWRTHRITSLKDPVTNEFGFWHFRNLTNNWDYDRSDWDSSLMEKDQLLIDTLSKAFPK
jgi:hypothetical protein